MMIDTHPVCHYKKPMKIAWDETKRLTNLDNHKLDFAGLTLEVFVAAIIQPTRSRRFKAIAGNGGQIISVVFSMPGSQALSLISMRPAGKKEMDLLR